MVSTVGIMFTHQILVVTFVRYVKLYASVSHSMYCSILLSNLLIKQSKGFESKQKIFSEEFELVTQALFTDPSDQSGWFYHLWLLAQTSSPENPQLIASWPSNGSNLSLSSLSSICCYSLKEGILPIVLYFNEPVKGLSSSGVSLNSDLVVSKNIQWRPLSVTDSGHSNCWVTYLEVSNLECNSLQQFSVEVSITNSDEIVSRSGSNYNCPVHFSFTFELSNNDSTAKDIDPIHELISWDFSEPLLSHVNPSCICFEQLKITNSLVHKESKWHLERLSDEIDLFRELHDDNRLGHFPLLHLLLNLFGFPFHIMPYFSASLQS